MGLYATAVLEHVHFKNSVGGFCQTKNVRAAVRRRMAALTYIYQLLCPLIRDRSLPKAESIMAALTCSSLSFGFQIEMAMVSHRADQNQNQSF